MWKKMKKKKMMNKNKNTHKETQWLGKDEV